MVRESVSKRKSGKGAGPPAGLPQHAFSAI